MPRGERARACTETELKYNFLQQVVLQPPSRAKNREVGQHRHQSALFFKKRYSQNLRGLVVYREDQLCHKIVCNSPNLADADFPALTSDAFTNLSRKTQKQWKYL